MGPLGWENTLVEMRELRGTLYMDIHWSSDRMSSLVHPIDAYGGGEDARRSGLGEVGVGMGLRTGCQVITSEDVKSNELVERWVSRIGIGSGVIVYHPWGPAASAEGGQRRTDGRTACRGTTGIMVRCGKVRYGVLRDITNAGYGRG